MMIDIAMNQNEGPVSVRDIARRQSLSDKYLEQIITQANKAGLLKASEAQAADINCLVRQRIFPWGDPACDGRLLSPVECVRERGGTRPLPKCRECATMSFGGISKLR